MSVAPHAGVVDFGTFTPPTLSKDGIQGEVPQPLIGQENYVLTGNGWSSLGALGALTYQGTWDASTNTPTLVSSVGTQGYYYVVSVAGNTDLNGTTTWDVGDWAIFNGSAWQKIEGGTVGTFTNVITPQVTARTDNLTLSAISTGAVNLNTAGSTLFKVTDDSTGTSVSNEIRFTGAKVGLGRQRFSFSNAAWFTTGDHFSFRNGAVTSDGNEQFRISPTTGAVNYLQVTGATTGNSPALSAQGSDANVNLLLNPKGNAQLNVFINGGSQFRVTNVASAVNYIQAQGSTTGNQPFLWVGGTDTNIALGLSSKGDGNVNIFTNGGGNAQLQVSHTASAVNYVRVTGAATTGSPVISAQGSDASPHLLLSGKGSGGVKAQTYFQVGYNYANYLSLSGSNTTQALTTSAAGSDTNISLAFLPKGTGAINLAAGSSGVNISNGGTVTAITRTSAGIAYTVIPTISISAPTTASGVQATASCTVNVYGAALVSGGSGYTVGDVLTAVGGTGTAVNVTVATLGAGNSVATVTYNNYGNYSVIPTNPVTLSGGTGTGCTFNYTYSVNIITIGNAGSGYIEQPSVTFTGANSTPAAAYATIGSGTSVDTLGSSLSFFTPGGETMRLIDPASSTVNRYFEVRGGIAGSSGVRIGVTNESMDYYTTNGYAHYFSTQGARTSIQFVVNHTTSAVNYLQVNGSATGSATGAILSTQGSDTNVPMQIQGKGTGSVSVLTPTTLGGTTGNTAELFAAKGSNSNSIWLRAYQVRNTTGTDWTTASLRLGQRIDSTDMSYIEFNPSGFTQGIAIQTANNQPINFNTSGAQFRVGVSASSVNYVQAQGGATTRVPFISAQGSDTNLALALQSKGTGGIDLVTGSAGVNISNGGTVTNITRTNQGSGYTTITGLTWTASAPTITGGVTATGTVTSLGGVSATIAGGGTGYTAGNVLTVVGGTFSSASTITVNTVSGGVITGATLTNGGTYTVIPTNPVSVTGGSGTGATFNVTYGILGLSITTAGSGYVEEPTVTFSGGGGSGAVAYATVGSNTSQKTLGNIHTFSTPNSVVLAIVDKNSSSGYPTNSTVAFSMVPNQNNFAGNFFGSSAPLYFATASTSTTEAFIFATSVGTPVSNGGGGPSQFRIVHTASAVNYVQVTGQVTGAGASALGGILFTGSDTNVNGAITMKGTGYIAFSGSSLSASQAFRVNTTNAISTGNLLQVQGAAAGSTPSIQAINGPTGTDANISLNLVTKGTGTVQQNGNPLAQVNHKYHAFTVGSYYFDSYEQNNYFRLFTQNAAADTIRYGAVTSPEYYDYGTLTWTAWAAGLTGIQNLLDGNPNTGMNVAHANRTFRFVVANSDGWPTNALVVLQTTWAAITYTTATVTIASGTSAAGPFTTRQVMTFSSANSGNNWGMHAYYTGSIHTGNGFYQITVDITDWVDSGTYVSYPLINLNIFSNYSTVAGRMVPYSNSYDRTSIFIGGIRTAADVNGVLDIGRYSAADPTTYIDSGSNASRIILRTQYTEQLRLSHTASAVNYVQVTGGATNVSPVISAQGSDTNISLNLSSKGTGVVNSNPAMNIGRGAFNWMQIAGGAATGNAPSINALGTDTNIDLALTPKGTGRLRFGTHTANADAPITGYIEILDSSGTIRKLAVIS